MRGSPQKARCGHALHNPGRLPLALTERSKPQLELLPEPKPEGPLEGTSPLRKLVVIDGANAIYRAFFAIPGLRAPDGTPTNAALGFTNMLAKVIREEQPDFIAVAMDPRGGSFRKRVYPDYKANRDAQPEDLSLQMPLVRELIEAFRVSILEVPDFEADDVIATLVALAPDDTVVTIVSTDKDLMQLVSDRVTLVDGVKDRRYGPAEVEERFGVPPEKILDLRSLVGDPSDNIPGVKGIGEKGAAKLIQEWGTLENLLEHAADVKAKRAREALLEQAEAARLSKELSTLRYDVPLSSAFAGSEESPKSDDSTQQTGPRARAAQPGQPGQPGQPDSAGFASLAVQEPDRARLRELYQRLGFTRMLDALDVADSGSTGRAVTDLQSPEGLAEGPRMAPAVEVDVLTDATSLREFIRAQDAAVPLALYAVVGLGSVIDARLIGVALAGDDLRAGYAPVVGEGLVAESGLSDLELATQLRDALGGESEPVRAWFGTEVKRAQAVLGELGANLPAPVADIELAGFLLDPASAKGVPPLASGFAQRSVSSWEDLSGRGAKAIPAAEISVSELSGWAAQQVCALQALLPRLRERLEQDGLVPLFDDVEMPLTGVLAQMERAGVRIDEARLAELSEQYEGDLSRLEAEIHDLAGEKFLVSSPKQLQVILFEKLKLPVSKKTKTGFSTAEDVLEKLSAHHELPIRILAWRRLAKLKSTYLDALPALVSPLSGRVHPTFNQTGAATGRLSATNPNVQNIPIRTEEGIRIREAFIPAEGCVLVSADYSQVELRILAHYSDDQSLLDAFQQGEDIHRRTAAEVAGITPLEVTAEQRAQAKAVNFGIIYGSSAYGLANQLGIATSEAQGIIDAYFERYRGVRSFLDATVAEAKQRGYVTTLWGRRRYLPDLNSRNRVLRQAAERMAVNTVIQGSEADLIKRAMVKIAAALAAEGLNSRMILQVHDELVFEVPTGELKVLSALARREMQGAFKLRVPLLVDIGVGATWREAH